MNIEATKIIKVIVKENSSRYAVSQPIYKEDYGLYLLIEGLELPEIYTVDFSASETASSSVSMIGNSDGVLIPQQFIRTGQDIFAFLYLTGNEFGRTIYKFKIPNRIRPDRTNEEPEPEEQSLIDQAISALNSAVAKTAQDVISADQSAQAASDDADRAESARDDAQTYADNAQTSASQASASATASAQSAQQASASASTASAAANNAAASAASAATNADRAEQSAAQSGYLWFYIEDGKLYMDRTENTHVDFYMQDGKLYVEEIA